MEAPAFVWPVVLASFVLAIALVSWMVYRAHPSSPMTPTVVAAVLFAWLVATVVLSGMGAYSARADRPPTIEFGLLLPLIAGLVIYWSSEPVRQLVRRIPPAWLIGAQTVRLVGGLFLVLWAMGRLPAQFALPAGIGDVIVGASAPFVAWAVSRSPERARTLAIGWNLFGILDLLVAVGTGMLSSSGPLHLLHGQPPADLMGRLPLSVIPTFGIPIWLLAHFASLGQLSHPAPARRPRLVLQTQ